MNFPGAEELANTLKELDWTPPAKKKRRLKRWQKIVLIDLIVLITLCPIAYRLGSGGWPW